MRKHVKSPLKWAGSKTKSLDFIVGAISVKPKRFVEPFAGSAVVSFNIEADEYLIADINNDVINFFNILKEYRMDFIEYCKQLFIDGNNKDIYYYNRRIFNNLDFDYYRAALFLYLNRHCFNGLCRYNASGKFNVPFGKYKNIYFPEEEMLSLLSRINRYIFKCQSFEATFNECSKNDVIYCDPPYLPLTDTSNFTDYTSEGFTFEMHEKLVKLAEKSSSLVLISNHWIPGVTDILYKNGDVSRRKITCRYISAYSRPKVEEVLVVYD